MSLRSAVDRNAVWDAGHVEGSSALLMPQGQSFWCCLVAEQYLVRVICKQSRVFYLATAAIESSFHGLFRAAL